MNKTVCGAEHPTPEVDATCGQEPGPNATTEAHHSFDDDGNEIEDEYVPGQDVHVHKGEDSDGGVHRWEDTPES